MSIYHFNTINKGKGLVDFKLEYCPEEYEGMTRQDWETAYLTRLKSDYKYYEFPKCNLKQALAICKLNKGTGLVVAKDGWDIILPRGCGQALAIVNMGKAILKSWKTHNAGAKQKQRAMQNKSKAEAWNVYVKTKCN